MRSGRLCQEARTAACESDDAWRQAVNLYAGSLATLRVTESAYRKATEKREEDAE